MLDWQQVHAAVRPLRLIFWGASYIWIIDLTFTTTTNGTGFRFDLLDDTLATVMISVAVFRLAPPGAKALPGRDGIHQGCRDPRRLRHRASAFRLRPPRHPCLRVGIHRTRRTHRDHPLLPRHEMVLPGRRSSSTGGELACDVPAVRLYLRIAPGRAVHPRADLPDHRTDLPYTSTFSPGLLLLPLFIVPLVHLFVSTSRMRTVSLTQALRRSITPQAASPSSSPTRHQKNPAQTSDERSQKKRPAPPPPPPPPPLAASPHRPRQSAPPNSFPGNFATLVTVQFSESRRIHPTSTWTSASSVESRLARGRIRTPRAVLRTKKLERQHLRFRLSHIFPPSHPLCSPNCASPKKIPLNACRP